MQEIVVNYPTGKENVQFQSLVFSFILNLSPDMTTVIECEMKVQIDAEQAVSEVTFILSSGGYMKGNHLLKDGLLMDKTSSIYLYVKLNDCNFFL